MLIGKAKWVGGFKFDAWDSDGRELKLDASVTAGGEGDGFRPVELPMVALASCTGMDVVEILQKMRQPVTGLEVTATSDKRGGYPSEYADIELAYVIRGNGLSPKKVEEAVRLSEEKYCTVGRALSKATTITHTITILED